jgi:hypothetical protein
MLWASSIDVDARVTPLEAPGNPKAAAPEQPVSAQPAIQRLRRSVSISDSAMLSAAMRSGAVASRQTEQRRRASHPRLEGAPFGLSLSHRFGRRKRGCPARRAIAVRPPRLGGGRSPNR